MMLDYPTTGRVQWSKCHGFLWLFEVEIVLRNDETLWLTTYWWIRKPAFSLKYSVVLVNPQKREVRTIRKFWCLKNAKAYVEVCYRMGVEL